MLDVRCTVRRRDAYPRAVIAIVTRLHSVLSGVTIAARERDFSLLQNVRTCPGTHPASYSVLIGSHFLGIKPSKCEADLSRPPFVHPLLRLRMNWAIRRFLMCLYDLHRDNYAFWPFAYWEAWDSRLFKFREWNTANIGQYCKNLLSPFFLLYSASFCAVFCSVLSFLPP